MYDARYKTCELSCPVSKLNPRIELGWRTKPQENLTITGLLMDLQVYPQSTTQLEFLQFMNSTDYFCFYSIYTLLCVRLYPMNDKTALPIVPKYRVGPYMTPGEVNGCLRLQKIVFQSFWFLKNFKCSKKSIIKSASFFCCFFFTVKTEDAYR